MFLWGMQYVYTEVHSLTVLLTFFGSDFTAKLFHIFLVALIELCKSSFFELFEKYLRAPV